MIYTGIVLKGNQDGRKIDFPTLNLSPSLIPQNLQHGVYVSTVAYKNKIYLGALYFGPRLVKKESHTVLEIHVIDFNQEIYNKKVEFEIGNFIRDIRDFSSMEELKLQIKKDIEKVKNLSTLKNDF